MTLPIPALSDWAKVVQAETQGLKAYADEVCTFGPLTAYSSGPLALPTDGAMLDPAIPLTEADLAGLLGFFKECGIAPKIQTLGHVLPESLNVLRRAGFGLEYTLHLYTHNLHGLATPSAPFTEQATDRTKWAAVATQAFGEDSAAIMQANALRPDLECWWALIDGVPAGIGALTVDENGVASLFSAATLPLRRAQGVQSALLAARLHSAKRQGARLATVFVAPGSGSERNVARLGFSLSGVRLNFVM